MLKPRYHNAWPDLWKGGYAFDEVEIWGSRRNLGHSYAYENRRVRILDAVEQLLPLGSVLIDVAAAQGNFTLPLAEKGYRVVWNDIRPDLIGYVQLKYECGQVTCSPGNIFDLAAEFSGHFDGVIATEVIEHVAHPDEFLVTLASLVKPGGRIFLTTPNGRYFRFGLPKFSDFKNPAIFESIQFQPDSDSHIFLLHPDEFLPLAERAGLTIERFELVTSPLTHGHIKLGKLLPYLSKSLVWKVEAAIQKLPKQARELLYATSIAVLRKS